MSSIRIPRLSIERVQGDTFAQSALIRESASGDPVDISSATITVATAADRGSAVIDSATNGSGVTITDGPNGKFEWSIALTPSDYPAGKYEFDIQVEIGGVVTTRVAGTLRVLGDIAP